MRRRRTPHHSYRTITNDRAAELLALYLPIGLSFRPIYPAIDAADYRAEVEDAILEAAVTFDPTRGASEKTWIVRLIRWRLDQTSMALVNVPRANGHAFDETEVTPDPIDGDLALLRELAARAVERLTPRHQAVIAERVEGATYAEIGQSLGISTARAHVEVQRALTLLRSMLEDDARD